jgi:hypothetical protein
VQEFSSLAGSKSCAWQGLSSLRVEQVHRMGPQLASRAVGGQTKAGQRAQQQMLCLVVTLWLPWSKGQVHDAVDVVVLVAISDMPRSWLTARPQIVPWKRKWSPSGGTALGDCQGYSSEILRDTPRLVVGVTGAATVDNLGEFGLRCTHGSCGLSSHWTLPQKSTVQLFGLPGAHECVSSIMIVLVSTLGASTTGRSYHACSTFESQSLDFWLSTPTSITRPRHDMIAGQLFCLHLLFATPCALHHHRLHPTHCG